MIYVASFDKHTLEHFPTAMHRLRCIGWSESYQLAKLFADKVLLAEKPNKNTKIQIAAYENAREVGELLVLGNHSTFSLNSVYGVYGVFGTRVPFDNTVRLSEENCRITTIKDKRGHAIAITNSYLKRIFNGNFQVKIKKDVRKNHNKLRAMMLILRVVFRDDAIKNLLPIVIMLDESLSTNHGREIDYIKYAIDSGMASEYCAKL